MKAAVCHEFGKPLVIEDVAIANPTGMQVKVKIGACAICHSDIHYAEGSWGGQLPAIYGHEAAGVVEEVGPNVRHLNAGDRVIVTLIKSCGSCHYCDQGEPVMCDDANASDTDKMITNSNGEGVIQGMKAGAFAEYAVVEETQTAKIPDEMAFDVASLLSCGVITGVGAVINTAKVRPGASVVVIGVGGVGLNSVQGAKLSGARTIIALDTEDEKLPIAKKFGATHGINVNDPDLKDRIVALTNGRGADHVFVTVGAKSAIDQSYKFLGRGGEVVIVGMPAVGVKSEFYPLNLAGSVQSVRGSFMGQTRLSIDIPWLLEQYQHGRLKLDELISNRYSLEQINEAIEDTLGGRSLRNVLIIDDAL